MSAILSVWPEGNYALWVPPIESHWGSLRASVRFVRGEHGVGLIVRWSCESANTGRTEMAFGNCDPFWSTADLAHHLADVAARNLSMIMDVPAYEARMLATLAGYTNANVEWVADYIKATGVEIPHKADMDASTEASPAETAQAEAKAKVAKKRAAKLAESAKAPEETSPSPVECAAPAVVKEPLMTGPTHFRGVLLRDAADWADPSAEGVFVGVSSADYHADKGSLSSTRVRSLVQSEAHALVPVEISKAARDIGTLVHGFSLEGFTSAEQMGFKVVEGKTTTKEGCVTTDMIATAQACVKALRDDDNTRALIAREGLSELSVRVRCPDTGLMLRARFDRAPSEGFGCFDIKTTGGTIEQFVSSFFEFGYDIGAFHYLRVSDLAGLGYRGMSFPVVCKEAPHEVGLFHFANAEQVADEWDLAAKSHRTACIRELHIRQTGEARKRTHEPVWPNAKPWQVESRRKRLGDSEIPY